MSDKPFSVWSDIPDCFRRNIHNCGDAAQQGTRILEKKGDIVTERCLVNIFACVAKLNKDRGIAVSVQPSAVSQQATLTTETRRHGEIASSGQGSANSNKPSVPQPLAISQNDSHNFCFDFSIHLVHVIKMPRKIRDIIT